MRQSWRDPRLAHDRNQSEHITSNITIDDIWIPDTYFENAKNSYFHSVTVPNRMVKIDSDGIVSYNVR